MRRFGLTGYPLGHSFSARYFTSKFRNEGLSDCEYLNYPLPEATSIRNLFEEDNLLAGLNVTIPHKKAVLPFIDEIDEEASQIGAVNVIKAFREVSRIRLKGYNTDSYGFGASLPDDIRVRGGEALILGSGGAAAAVYHSLSRLGFEPLIVSRVGTPGAFTYDDLSSDVIHRAAVIVNATPLGMYPHVDTKPSIDYSTLWPEQLMYDLVYNPEVTLFMKEGTDMGCRVMNGLKMLEKQAEKAWEIWNDPSL